MRHVDYRTLVNQGRKAGLRTNEMYGAMTSRPMEAGDRGLGQADGNGFVTTFDQQGHVVFRPGNGSTNS